MKEHGADCYIICPKMRGFDKSYECISGIHIYRYPLPVEANKVWAYFIEYGTSLFFQFWLTAWLFTKKRFDVIDACNPPDLLFLVALPFKLLFGVKYVFDHHDVNPELFYAKFERKGLFYHILVCMERLTFKAADYTIATNESYKEIAIERGGMSPERVMVVRGGPSLERMKLTPGNPAYKRGKQVLVGYLGVISEQEGLDYLLQAARMIKEQRDDFQFAIVGGGTDLGLVKKYAEKCGVSDMVDFYGRVSDEKLVDILNTCDICVNPDKPSEMNNISTMNKIMEYMALKKPIVQFDLKEGRASALDAALYVKHHDIRDFADCAKSWASSAMSA